MGILERLFKKEPENFPMEEVKEEFTNLAEAMGERAFVTRVNQEVKNLVNDASYFQAFSDGSGSEGNYFNSEFNIRATAGRVKSLYAKEPWVYAAASKIVKAMSRVPLKVYDKASGELLDSHPLNTIMAKGSTHVDAFTLQTNLNLDLILGGNSFRIYNETYSESWQGPVELIELNYNRETRAIETITIWDGVNNSSRRTIPYKYVIHTRTPNPFNPFWGMSIFTAASRPLIIDRYRSEFEMAFYLRGATNAGVIEATEDIQKSRMERLMKTFEQVYTGKRNWWRTIFLPKGTKWVSAGLTMAEMQHIESMRENRLSILAAIGVPPNQLGIVQDVNRSTSEIQSEIFWTDTVAPMVDLVAGAWNNSHLVKNIYRGVEVKPDYSGIPAIQGSLERKGVDAKALEPYYLIDEIRSKVFGDDPLPEGKGQQFTAEIRGVQSATTPLSLSVSAPVVDTIADPKALFATSKANAVNSQERIEQKLGSKFAAKVEKYTNTILDVAAEALRRNLSPQAALLEGQSIFVKELTEGTKDILILALERGFDFAQAQAKLFNESASKKWVAKALRFREVDEEAVQALREEQRDGKREALVKRKIETFFGMTETRTNQVLSVIAEQMESGKTTDQIASTLRQVFQEKYKNQSFTVARTEILTAISEGIKWNNDILGEVFTEVKKQWFHVGDVGSNPHARLNHYEFEQMGPQDASYKYAGIMAYPRDPSGGAEEVINCRCSMTSYVPDTAQSNAEIILDRI